MESDSEYLRALAQNDYTIDGKLLESGHRLQTIAKKLQTDELERAKQIFAVKQLLAEIEVLKQMVVREFNAATKLLQLCRANSKEFSAELCSAIDALLVRWKGKDK